MSRMKITKTMAIESPALAAVDNPLEFGVNGVAWAAVTEGSGIVVVRVVVPTKPVAVVNTSDINASDVTNATASSEIETTGVHCVIDKGVVGIYVTGVTPDSCRSMSVRRPRRAAAVAVCIPKVGPKESQIIALIGRDELLMQKKKISSEVTMNPLDDWNTIILARTSPSLIGHPRQEPLHISYRNNR